MAKIVFIGSIDTLETAGSPPSAVRRYINLDNIVLATLKNVGEVWIWSFKMSDGTSLDSMTFDDYDQAITWANENKITEDK